MTRWTPPRWRGCASAREPGGGIGIVTRVWQLAKLFGEDRRRILAAAGADPAILDLLSVLPRAGTPYQLTTREVTERTRVTAGGISQRVARAENAGLVQRAAAGDGSRAVLVTLTPAGHALVESLVDRLLHREAELISGLAPHQRAALTELLRLLLDDVQHRVGPYRHTQGESPVMSRGCNPSECNGVLLVIPGPAPDPGEEDCDKQDRRRSHAR